MFFGHTAFDNFFVITGFAQIQAYTVCSLGSIRVPYSGAVFALVCWNTVTVFFQKHIEKILL